MYIQSFRLRGLPILVLNLALVAKALPVSHFNPTRGDVDSILSGTEPSSKGSDSALLESDVSSSGINLYSPEDSPDLLALASTQTDATGSLLHGSDQLGTETGSSGNGNLFGDLGPASGLGDVSLPDDTLALSNSGSDQPNLASSPDLFAGDDPGGSSSTLAYVPSNLLTPEDKPLPDGSSIPDSVNLVEDKSVSGDDIVLDSVNPAEATSLPKDDTLPKESTLPKDDTLPKDNTPFNTVDPASNTFISGDGSITDSVNPAEDASSSGLDNTEGTLVASGKKASLEGSTIAPTCEGRKTPACCLTKAEGMTLPGYKDGCTSCTFFSVSPIACLSHV